MSQRDRKLIGVLAGVLGAIGVTGAAVAATSSGHSAVHRAKHRAHHVRGHVAGAQAAFPVLSRPATSADALPAYVSGGFRPTSPIELSQSRLVGSVSGGQAWLVPETDGGVCLIVSGGTNAASGPTSAGACTSATVAATTGIGIGGPTGTILMLPAGSSNVRVSAAGASATSLAPNSNGLVTIPVGYQRASYTGPDGSAHSMNASATGVASVAG
jgi:hypothetical protein